MWKPAPRETQTTIPCANCKKPLMARRTCHEARLCCKACGREYALGEYVAGMDEALERFLETVNCDRV